MAETPQPEQSPLTPPDGISLLHTLSTRTGSVSSLAWSPDGALLASGSIDGTVRLWNSRDGSLLHSLSAYTSSVLSLAWSPDGALLASSSISDYSSSDAEVCIWGTATWEPLALLTGLKGEGYIAWHPHLPLLATSGQREEDIIIWLAAT